MEFFNRNDNKKRKSNEGNPSISEKKVRREESVGCFRRCCAKKKNSIGPNRKHKTLKKSEFFHESIFCGNRTEVYDDPCTQCTVQRGPDLSENIPGRRSNADKTGAASSLHHLNQITNANSENVDGAIARERSASVRMENAVKTNSIDQKREEKLRNEDHQKSSDSDPKRPSSDNLLGGYDWDLALNSSNINQQTISRQTNSTHHFEPYNWDDPQYLTSAPDNSTTNLPKDRSHQSVANDYYTVSSGHEKTNHSYSTASVLSSDNASKVFHSPPSFSTAVFNEHVDDQTRTEAKEKDKSASNTLNQLRTTYDEIMTTCRDFLHLLFSSMSPTDLSPTKTCTWSTDTSSSTPFDHLGPWWGRRDSSDQIPATFLFTHQSLSESSSSMESLMSSEQMCISLESRSACFWKYSHYCS